MCGLAAAFFGGISPSGEMRDRHWELFRRNLLANEKRGREATGVAVVQRTGIRRVWKFPCPASEFVLRPEFERAREAFCENTVCLLGHTRLPTKGCQSVRTNNQPIVTGSVIGIHNGEIENDNLLFSVLGLRRRGEVDSEAIFAVLSGIPGELGGDARVRALRERIDRIEGRFAFAAMDMRHPEELLVVRQDVPLSMHYDAGSDALLLSSRYLFLRQTFGRSVIAQQLHAGHGYVFRSNDLSRRDPRFSASFRLAG